MLEFLKTSAGAYNLTFILAILGWLITGVGIFAGFHLTKVRAVESDAKARKAEVQRVETVEELRIAKAEASAAKKLADDLEAKQRPRSIPDDVLATITAIASTAPKKDILQITCVVGDNEAWALAEQIKSAFEKGGFTFDRIVPVITTPPFSGIRAGSRDLRPSPVHDAVGVILKHFKMPLSAEPIPENEPFVWSIRIGKKP
jgi:hypothetical protein